MTKQQYTLGGVSLELPMSPQEAKKFVMGLCPSARIDVLTAMLSGVFPGTDKDGVLNVKSEGVQ